jgi:hypothetical protein
MEGPRLLGKRQRLSRPLCCPEPGQYWYRTECTDQDDPGLHGRKGELEVIPYQGASDLYQHGRLQVAANRHTLEQVDGTPFFWMGDTWWFGLVKRRPR